MLEVLQFIFSSFWVFLGTLVIILSIVGGLSKILLCFTRSKKIKDLSDDTLFRIVEISNNTVISDSEKLCIIRALIKTCATQNLGTELGKK